MLAKLFPRNENTLDRAFRVLLGAGLLSLAFVGPQTPWGWVGLIPLVTGAVGSCPLYRIFGMSTCPLER
ncbi:MAG: DUF2892 domain-containing protein [Myxococcota bacterium]